MSYKIEKIIVYPVKSLPGIEVESQKALSSGFEWDRKWMITDKEGIFISQRKYPKLACVSLSMEEDHLQIKSKTSISIPKLMETGKAAKVKVWSHWVDAIEVSDEANAFFSDLLDQHCRLVKMNRSSKRMKSLIVPPRKTDLSFADGYPYLILGTASIDLLNSKLEQKIDHRRFRPNLLIQTNKPHEEDSWKDLQIGKHLFRMVKPCVRCNVISIDQDLGIQTREPSNTLAAYRKVKNSITYGMNAICLTEGFIARSHELTMI